MGKPHLDPENRPAQLDSPVVAALIKWGSRANTALYKATGGRLGGTWRVGAAARNPVPVALLTTIGRKSGKPRTAPLLYLRRGDDFVVVASQGGSATHPAWYLNLRDNPDVSIQVGKDTYELRAVPQRIPSAHRSGRNSWITTPTSTPTPPGPIRDPPNASSRW